MASFLNGFNICINSNASFVSRYIYTISMVLPQYSWVRCHYVSPHTLNPMQSDFRGIPLLSYIELTSFGFIPYQLSVLTRPVTTRPVTTHDYRALFYLCDILPSPGLGQAGWKSLFFSPANCYLLCLHIVSFRFYCV